MAEAVSVLNLLIALGGLLIAGTGVLLANNRYRDRRMNERFDALNDRIEAVDARVDDTRETFVHNDHLQQIARDFKDGLATVREEQRSTNTRIDAVLTHMIKQADAKRGP